MLNILTKGKGRKEILYRGCKKGAAVSNPRVKKRGLESASPIC
jgi:hypothetical protein